MVLLHQIIFDKSEQISHYKSSDNPLYICSPRESYNKHGWMEGWIPLSIGRWIFYMKPYRIYVAFSLSSIEYLDWKI